MSTSEQNVERERISLLLRLPLDGTSIENIASAHNEKILEHGFVWLGIVGKTLSADNVRLINRDGEFFYLVQNMPRTGISIYKGGIADFSKSLPEAQRSLVPTYYHDAGITDRAKLWVKLRSLKRIPPLEIEKLRVISSGKNASVLLNGMAYFGMVQKR